jgi:hypothetical protein
MNVVAKTSEFTAEKFHNEEAEATSLAYECSDVPDLQLVNVIFYNKLSYY